MTKYTQQAVIELVAKAVAFTPIKVERTTTQGSQTEIIEQVRQGTYEPRTAIEWQANITIGGVTLVEWAEAIGFKEYATNFYTYKVKTKKELTALVYEDVVLPIAKDIQQALEGNWFATRLDEEVAEKAIALIEKYILDSEA